MAKKTSSVSFRIDADIKKQADELFAKLGLNMTTAFNIFLRQSIREGRIPFDITLNTPNAVTVAALLEAEQIANNSDAKRYSDVEEALRELKS
ncbi:MAG: type II toxin-antitoxin system RelB/DinJ family antitoxin [Tepidanaerobacter acetatoxydans]|uniref:Addiction module antitoxin, RelB/DinJ family n=1 Tax=Tepidanaerobacter acetatoxydans (strain DSM 21804 / JCM 16047 / Re1) TaxID=1209989 RepID=F4LT95_TEPAE|nr:MULTISPECIES: type II toxin-antitoxin system RelB/DinJ family antitoxin [Tepidanaerobacter]AEE92495.1 addiction module antitoxin, RelB/DinJ family [Tepidanaerobacter acetatoxydans Re1]NLU09640.1 type II toxin-antitoxin system RelB/DinJ family antitoxin [Tepidanaerobacter acetatoxydans]CCP27438.1 Addiction module antitoxin, RelB/DinJ family [Tepidanaerobacter acetatoxydans Re1]